MILFIQLCGLMMRLILIILLIVSSLSNNLFSKSHSNIGGNEKPQLELLSPIVNENNFRFIAGKRCVDIKSSSTLHLRCRGNKPLIWAFPQNHFEELENIKYLATVENKCERYKGDQLCTSDFKLPNASYEQTGQYTCFCNYTDVQMLPKNSESLYIFFNDDLNLLVPLEGNQYINISVIQSQPIIIPCLPTNSRVTVTLWDPTSLTEIKVGDNYSVYSPTTGFFFQNPHWDQETTYLSCEATLGTTTQNTMVSIHWSIIPEYGLYPKIPETVKKNEGIYPFNVTDDTGYMYTTNKFITVYDSYVNFTMDLDMDKVVTQSNSFKTLAKSQRVTGENNIVAKVVGIVICVIVGVMFLIMVLFFVKRIRKDSRELEFINQSLFDNEKFQMFNPDISLDEQIDLLPYEKRWEFPKERLKLGRTLGQGAFGRVVRAEAVGFEDGENSTTVAVKMLKERGNVMQTKALMSELKIMIHLGKHLNIVNLLGAVTKNLVNGELFVMVEYCRCGNLRSYLLENRENFVNQINTTTGEVDNYAKSVDSTNDSPVEKVPYIQIDIRQNAGSKNLNYMFQSVIDDWSKKSKNAIVTTHHLIYYGFQVAKGMEYLSRRNLIHRDLAARNVLLADDNIVKICDFGLAKDCYNYDNYIKKCGGPLPVKWMAIESILDKVYTTKSDVWSFGVVLWELFTLGGCPYPGLQVNEDFYKKLKSGYRMGRPELSPKIIYKLMIKCWNSESQKRPDFTCLADELGNMLEPSIRQKYFDQNDSYEQVNASSQQNDYLQMSAGSPVNLHWTPSKCNKTLKQNPVNHNISEPNLYELCVHNIGDL